MLVRAKAHAKAAASVPDIVACVVVHPVGHGERHTVEEHVSAKVLICLA